MTAIVVRASTAVAPPPPQVPVPTKTVNPAVAVGPWTTADGFAVTNYHVPIGPGSAAAAQQPGDIVRVYAVGATSPTNRYLYNTLFTFKGVANGTANARILWVQNPGDYLRFDLTAGFGLIPTAYGSAGPGGIWQATTDWSVGQGIFHLEGMSFIDFDFRDGLGGFGVEIGNPANWNPNGNPNANPFAGYVNYQSHTVVSTHDWTVQGMWIHGANQYNAGYMGWDCFNFIYNQCWWDKHGTNYGFKAGNGSIEAAGNMFMAFGHDGIFSNCKSTFCGHDTGPGVWGYNTDVVNGDYSGDWTAYNTGRPYGYVANNYSGSIQQGLPTFPAPYPGNIKCGPNRFINCRLTGFGPGELAGAPAMGFVGYATILRQCVIYGGQAGGHAIQEANFGNGLPSSNILCVGFTQMCHCSVYGTPGIYDATDSGVTAAMHPQTYQLDSWINNVFDNNQVTGGPSGFLIRHYQITSNAGSTTLAQNKGCQVINNVLNAQAPGDPSGDSIQMTFGAYIGGAASIRNVSWTDSGSTFPGDIFGNLLQPITWNNLAGANGTLPQALAGLTLNPASNPGCIGTAAPLATVTTGTTSVTIVVSNPYRFWGGNAVGSAPDYVAITPVGGGPPRIVQLAPGGVNFAANSLTFVSSVTVNTGDKLNWVQSDNLTPLLNWGRL